MKFYEERGVWVLEMTRRNLQALLDKLDDPQSARSLGKTSEDLGSYVLVTAVEDEEHYADRPPGQKISHYRYSPELGM